MTAAIRDTPDVEALIWSRIHPFGDVPGAEVRSWAYARVPTSGPRGWSVQVSMQIDVRDTTKQRAFARASQVLATVLCLPGTPWDEGIVTDAQLIDGPSWLPDIESGRPRYVIQALVQAHPPRQRKETAR